MPTGAERSALADTSVVVPALRELDPSSPACRRALQERRAGLAGHAYFETVSVMSRLPDRFHTDAASVIEALERNLGASRFLDAGEQAALTRHLATTDIGGGALYDALVGWAAVCADLPLLTLDRRALPTYRALGVQVEWVELG